MAENSEPTSTTASANSGVKKGLPLDGLPYCATAANSLWEVARFSLTPNKAYAEKLGRKSASGGSWARLVAVLRGFGLIKVEGEQIGLTPLGQELVNGSNPTQQLAARRTALLHLKAYRELVESFDGTTLPDQASLASRLKFEYGKKDDFAEEAAKAFMDSLVFAEMIDAAGVVRKNGADAAVEPDGDEEADDEQADLIDGAFEDEASASEAETPDPRPSQFNETQAFQRLNEPAHVSIAVSLDLSKYRADEVIQILRELRK